MTPDVSKDFDQIVWKYAGWPESLLYAHVSHILQSICYYSDNFTENRIYFWNTTRNQEYPM